jgi:hypothetical protein
MPQPLSTPREDPVPLVQETGGAPEPVWTGAENLAPTGIRYQDRPAHSQSLYRLSYPAYYIYIYIYIPLAGKGENMGEKWPVILLTNGELHAI